MSRNTIERPITDKANITETFADKPQPCGSYSGVEALADDETRIELGQKLHYPLRVANTHAPDSLSEEAKEARARDWAGEKGPIPRDLDTHLGNHPRWRNTDIPYSALTPELVSDQEQQKQRLDK